MRLKIVSDLHLEFSDINIKNEQNCDVLILSGDIMVAEDLHMHPCVTSPYQPYLNLGRRQEAAMRFRDFLKRVSFQFPHVIYVAGNHEFYHGKWKASLDHLRSECSQFPNVHFLEMQSVKLFDYNFLGATVWTNMNKGKPTTLYTTQNGMNDFHIIRNDEAGYTKLRPAHTVIRHRATLNYFKTEISKNPLEKYVVVGHHAPSNLSIHPNYRNDHDMNGAYASDLSEFILDHPQIKLWTHGHVHQPFDYMIGSTRIVCNPRGYEGYEPDTNWNPEMYIDL